MMEQVDGLFDEQQPFLCPDAVIENFLGKLLAIRYTSGVIQIESNDFGRSIDDFLPAITTKRNSKPRCEPGSG